MSSQVANYSFEKTYVEVVLAQLQSWIGRDAPRSAAARALDDWRFRDGLTPELREAVLGHFENSDRDPIPGVDFHPPLRHHGLALVLRVHARTEGAHIKARVWVGQEGHPGLTGELTMRPLEFAFFRAALNANLGKHVAIAYDGTTLAKVNHAEDAEAEHERAEAARMRAVKDANREWGEIS